MINEKKLNDITELLDMIADQPCDSNGRYRGYYLYRGVPNINYDMLTTLQRNCGSKSNVLEKALLRNFAKYTATEQNKEEESVWRSMMVGQHHGLPTRLLDWTHSPLVALNFAVSDSNFSDIDKNDCVVWRIDANEIHNLLPEPFQQEMKDTGARIFSIDMLNHVTKSLDQYDELTGGKSMVILEPPSIDPRMINQYAFFSIIPGQVDNIVDYLDRNTENTTKFIIPKELKWRVRDFLDEANISERTIYPGLDGICKWLARHYYVKE